MRKIPTVFQRDEQGLVTNEITEGCEWVFDPEVVSLPRRKYDGLCMRRESGCWFYRREVKPGKRVPDSFDLEYLDPNTDIQYGWVSIEEAFSYHKHFLKAVSLEPIESDYMGVEVGYVDGTYELIGPKINDGKDKTTEHRLARHDAAEHISNVPDAEATSFELLKSVFEIIDVEGVVWYDLDDPSRHAKLKRQDFGFAW